MDNLPDPRIRELKRLQLALEDASRHLDELEARLLEYMADAAVQTRSVNSKCGFAAHVAAGLEKVRHKQAVDGPELVGS